MVKNNTGGNKSKRMGRKFSAPQADKNIRLSESEEEIYASVTKLLGNGMFHAVDTDNKERLCIMRQKFKGRGKRDNTVTVGSWVLIGLRVWEGAGCSKPKCDLLEVYNDIEKGKLKKSGDPIFSKLRNDYDSISGPAKEDDSGFEFNDDDELAAEEYKNMIKDIMNKKKTSECEAREDSSCSPPTIEKVSASTEESEHKIESESESPPVSVFKKKRKSDDSRSSNTSRKVTIQVPTAIGTGDKSISFQEIDIDDI